VHAKRIFVFSHFSDFSISATCQLPPLGPRLPGEKTMEWKSGRANKLIYVGGGGGGLAIERYSTEHSAVANCRQHSLSMAENAFSTIAGLALVFMRARGDLDLNGFDVLIAAWFRSTF